MRDNPHLQQYDLPIWLAHSSTSLKDFMYLILLVDLLPFASKRIRLNLMMMHHPDGENSGNIKDQLISFEFWMDSYAIDDDEIPTQKVPQELMDEMSHTVDEEKLSKVIDEMKGIAERILSPLVTTIHKGHTQFSSKAAKETKKLLHYGLATSVVKKFNPYARYNVEHWIVSITESDYKNLNKNDIKDMYLLIVNNKVDDYVETGLLWSLSVFIRSTLSRERVHDFRQGVESYNNDVKHGYVISSLSNEDVEYLQLFKEETEEQLKHHNQMRWWEMYVNRRPLGSRRERPE
ncbi:hypothetical protein Tco_1019925 [Tanacetum coccineum]|uniref:Uncharacterized protein n=1 Tax=Tanacetum coccineum TaxID=301880 RepID=A0ABQ5G005_9ASTR